MKRSNILRMLAIGLLCALFPFFLMPAGNESMPLERIPVLGDVGSWNSCGPYVDEVFFNLIWGQKTEIAALKSGKIDYITEIITPNYIEELQANPNINLTKTQRMGYNCMVINCARYPFSIPAFRRALAYAFDKHIAAEIMWGDLGFALDSPIPPSCGIWHNDNITDIDHREPDVQAAKRELAAAGFRDLDGDGYVEAPNGTSFVFQPLYWSSISEFEQLLSASKPYWDQAGIPVEPIPGYELHYERMYHIPRDYDGALFSWNIVIPILRNLQRFTTDEIANPYGNFYNWSNATYDAYIDMLMNSSTFEGVVMAAHMAQRILLENVPMITICSNWEVYAHRNDRFENWIVSLGYGMGPNNHWIPQIVKLKEGVEGHDPVTETGGIFKIMITSGPINQNPLKATSDYTRFVLSQIYSSLIGELHPLDLSVTRHSNGLASSWTKALVGDHWEFTFNLHTNATWHDGVPVTADDVVFSYNYIYDNNIWKYRTYFPYFDSIEKVDEDTVKIIATSDSYWAWEYLRDWTILPEHVWNGIVSPADYSNPVPIGSGPFKWNERVKVEYIRLDFHPNYHRGIHRHYDIEWDPPPRYPLSLYVLIIVGVVAFSVWYLRKDQKVPRRVKTTWTPTSPQERLTPITPKMQYCSYCGQRLTNERQNCPHCGQQVME